MTTVIHRPLCQVIEQADNVQVEIPEWDGNPNTRYVRVTSNGSILYSATPHGDLAACASAAVSAACDDWKKNMVAAGRMLSGENWTEHVANVASLHVQGYGRDDQSQHAELEKLREQNRQLIAENERRSAEVAFLRGQIASASVDVSNLSDALHSLHSAVCIIGGMEVPSVATPKTATCTPFHPADSQSHPPDSEVPCHPQPEHASPSGSQSVPAQMPMGFRLES